MILTTVDYLLWIYTVISEYSRLEEIACINITHDYVKAWNLETTTLKQHLISIFGLHLVLIQRHTSHSSRQSQFQSKYGNTRAKIASNPVPRNDRCEAPLVDTAAAELADVVVVLPEPFGPEVDDTVVPEDPTSLELPDPEPPEEELLTETELGLLVVEFEYITLQLELEAEIETEPEIELEDELGVLVEELEVVPDTQPYSDILSSATLICNPTDITYKRIEYRPIQLSYIHAIECALRISCSWTILIALCAGLEAHRRNTS